VSWTYFASGSNQPGEILGFSDCGIDFGIAVHELRGDALQQIIRTDVKVFVDSGAFSEVDFNEDGPYVVKPITDKEWDKRLKVYERIAQELGDRAYLTAPDQVAFQSETLDRLSRYRDRLVAMAELGANIIVPYQKGWRSLVHVHDICSIMLPFDYIVGIPMKKDATSVEEIVTLLEHRRIDRLHLLGIGPRSKKWSSVIEPVIMASPLTDVFCDSVLLKSISGRSGGKGGGPRPLTVASDRSFWMVGDQAFGDVDNIDYTDHIGQPSSWGIGPKRWKKFFNSIGQKVPADIDEFFSGHPEYDFDLDELWVRTLKEQTATWRKREAINWLHGRGEI
jgi:hypothetical protein